MIKAFHSRLPVARNHVPFKPPKLYFKVQVSAYICPTRHDVITNIVRPGWDKKAQKAQKALMMDHYLEGDDSISADIGCSRDFNERDAKMIKKEKRAKAKKAIHEFEKVWNSGSNNTA